MRLAPLLLLLACEPTTIVHMEVQCDEAGATRAAELMAACTGSGQPRSLSVDDDTVDLAEWVDACGRQARATACPAVKVARLRGAGVKDIGYTRCDAKPLPAWAAKVCQ